MEENEQKALFFFNGKLVAIVCVLSAFQLLENQKFKKKTHFENL